MQSRALTLCCTAAALLAAAAGVGCSTQRITCSPNDLSGCVVDEIVVEGNQNVEDDEITAKIATSET